MFTGTDDQNTLASDVTTKKNISFIDITIYHWYMWIAAKESGI